MQVRRTDLIIHSELDGAPAPCANTTKGSKDASPLSSFFWRLDGGGEEPEEETMDLRGEELKTKTLNLSGKSVAK